MLAARTLAVFLITLGACFGTPPHVPGDLAGEVPVTVVNASNRDITFMMMWRDAGRDLPTATNWLGDGMRGAKIDNGKQRTFAIRPGTYRFAFLFADAYGQPNNTRFVAGTGIVGSPYEKPPVEIRRATELVVGTAPTMAAAPGVDRVSVPLIDTYGAAAANCKANGVPAGTAEECCSRLLDTASSRCAESTD